MALHAMNFQKSVVLLSVCAALASARPKLMPVPTVLNPQIHQTTYEDVTEDIQTAVPATASDPEVTLESKEVTGEKANASTDVDEASSIVKLIPPSSEEMGKKIVKQVVPRKQETIREILQNYDDIDDFFYEDEDDSYFGYDPLDHTFFPQPVILRDLLPQRYSYL